MHFVSHGEAARLGFVAGAADLSHSRRAAANFEERIAQASHRESALWEPQKWRRGKIPKQLKKELAG